MYLSKYLKIFPHPDKPGDKILYSNRRASILQAPESLLSRIADGALAKADEETLVRYGVLVPDPEKEREELLTRFDEANSKGRRFSAVLLLTMECNLACGYCFEEGVRGKYAMTAATADLLVDWIEREHIAGGRRVVLEFYGGEPLLSLDMIRTVAARLKKSSEANGLPFEFYLVTNGTLLTRPVAMELKELGLKSAKITLDGPRRLHDRSRPFVSGKGSFDIITGNIMQTLDIIDLQIGGNFTRENYREFPLLLDNLMEMGIAPEKLEMVQFNAVSGRPGGKAIPDYPDTCNCTSEEWFAEATVYLREEILRRGFHTPKPGPAGCMVEFDNDLVIGVDGSLYKCPVFVGREGFAIGDLKNGVCDRNPYGPGIWKNDECLDCPWLPMCFGGCRVMSYLRDGRIDGVDCWKEFLEATVEKCVLQDLKYRPGNNKAPRVNERPDE